MNQAPIQIWAFDDAPEEYKEKSPHGGDEDWLAIVPAGIDAESILWMEAGTPFAPCDSSFELLPNGDTLVISAHT